MAKQNAWTESRVFNQLRHVFPSPAFTRLPQVRNGTGYSRGKTRTADAIVLSTWPSRGLWMAGVEIKVSPQDWKKELANPDKASEIQAYCHHWYVACPRGIIAAATVPATWGLIEVDGTTAAIVKQATALTQKPIDMLLLCSIIRTAEEVTIPTDLVEEKISARVTEAIAAEARRREYEHNSLEDSVRRFEESSGLKISDSWYAGEIGAAVSFVRKVGVHRAVEMAKRLERDCTTAATIFHNAIEAVESGICVEEED